MPNFDLNRLYERITLRARVSRPSDSYTVDLLGQGIERIAQKLGEEATETLIAAISLKQNTQVEQKTRAEQENAQENAQESSKDLKNTQKNYQRALCEESADLLYHLCLLWYACDTTPQNVYEILAERAAKRDQKGDQESKEPQSRTQQQPPQK